jgi:ferrochelatase
MRRPAAVRRYLKQFLSDPRVVEIPRAVWWFILNLIILPFRSGQSAKKYASIWTREGSPLRTHTAAQALPARRARRARPSGPERGDGHALRLALAAGRAGKLKAEGAERILVLPAYPQYSGTTTGSIYDAVFQHYGTVRNIPSCASCATTTTTKAISARCSNPCSTTGNSTASRKSW